MPLVPYYFNMYERCIDCRKRFLRDTFRGRPPKRCPKCRELVKEKWRENKEK